MWSSRHNWQYIIQTNHFQERKTGSGKMGRKRRERQRTGAGKGKEQGDGSEGEERGMREGGILN